MAPKSDIARPVAPCPLSRGMKSPPMTSFASGFAKLSSAKKQTAMVDTRKVIKNSSFLTCKNRNRRLPASIINFSQS